MITVRYLMPHLPLKMTLFGSNYYIFTLSSDIYLVKIFSNFTKQNIKLWHLAYVLLLNKLAKLQFSMVETMFKKIFVCSKNIPSRYLEWQFLWWNEKWKKKSLLFHISDSTYFHVSTTKITKEKVYSLHPRTRFRPLLVF